MENASHSDHEQTISIIEVTKFTQNFRSRWFLTEMLQTAWDKDPMLKREIQMDGLKDLQANYGACTNVKYVSLGYTFFILQEKALWKTHL